jgi:hypothetical protein
VQTTSTRTLTTTIQPQDCIHTITTEEIASMQPLLPSNVNDGVSAVKDSDRVITYLLDAPATVYGVRFTTNVDAEVLVRYWTETGTLFKDKPVSVCINIKFHKFCFRSMKQQEQLQRTQHSSIP